jgi:hypothetical protein
MIPYAETVTYGSASATITWLAGPGFSPPRDEPPAGVLARPGPRPSAPPMLAAVDADARCAVAA